MSISRRAANFALAGILTMLAVWLGTRSPGSLLPLAELQVQDVIARHGRTAPPNPKLIFLAIDTASVSLDPETDLQRLFQLPESAAPERRALTLMSQYWPWPRDVYPLILDRLFAAGARAVAFDLNFPTPSAQDTEFAAALERYRGRVVIGSSFSATEGGSNGRRNVTLALPTTSLIPLQDPQDPRVGFVNFWPDADGVIRRAQFRANFAQFLDAPTDLGEGDYGSIAAQTLRSAGDGDRVPPGLESHQFRYAGAPGQGFPPRSVFEIFVPQYWERNFAAGRVFDGAVVVVGSSGNWQHDDHPTPFGLMAGAEIQLSVINALLDGQFLRSLAGFPWLAVHLLAGALALLLNLRICSPWRRLAALAALIILWLAVQWTLYNSAGLWMPVAGPLAILVGVGLVGFIFDLAVSLTEQLRLRLTLEERQRAQVMLEEINAGLEKRVAERTADLTSTNAQLSSALDEKSTLLKEVHHRVKNNLQVISSLLNLQSGYITDPAALQVFTESRNRVRSMALIHEKLYQSQDLARIDFGDYIRAVSGGLKATFGGSSGGIRIAVDADRIMLPVDSAVPCGLIVNELVTNSFKYAFRQREEGEIRISMKRLSDTHLQLSVSDDGIGFPADVDYRNTDSLGMQLVTTLSEQLDGAVALKNGTGTTFEISFPENNRTKL